MNIVIGVRDSARELHLDIDTGEAGLVARIEEAVSQSTLLDLTDSKGQRYLIPARSLAFVHISDQQERRVGFAVN